MRITWNIQSCQIHKVKLPKYRPSPLFWKQNYSSDSPRPAHSLAWTNFLDPRKIGVRFISNKLIFSSLLSKDVDIVYSIISWREMFTITLLSASIKLTLHQPFSIVFFISRIVRESSMRSRHSLLCIANSVLGICTLTASSSPFDRDFPVSLKSDHKRSASGSPFVFSDLVISPSMLQVDQLVNVNVSFKITNTGTRDGDAVRVVNNSKQLLSESIDRLNDWIIDWLID